MGLGSDLSWLWRFLTGSASELSALGTALSGWGDLYAFGCWISLGVFLAFVARGDDINFAAVIEVGFILLKGVVDESNTEAGVLPVFFLGSFGGVDLFLRFFGLGVIKFEHLKFITMKCQYWWKYKKSWSWNSIIEGIFIGSLGYFRSLPSLVGWVLLYFLHVELLRFYWIAN